MTKSSDPKIIIKDLGRGAQGISTYGEPSNRAGEIKNLRTRINAPATKRLPKTDPA